MSDKMFGHLEMDSHSKMSSRMLGHLEVNSCRPKKQETFGLGNLRF